MEIIKMDSGFAADSEVRKDGFYSKIKDLKGKMVWFRGINEVSPFHRAYLSDLSGDALLFTYDGESYVYPYWEVIIAV